ncbi:hypothetical protein JCM1841_000163 [Sporobolomyces salmonicolor]
MAVNLTNFAFLPAQRFSCYTLLSITSVSAFVLALALLIYGLSLIAGYNKPISTPTFASASPALHHAAPPAPLGLGLSLGPAISLSSSHERRRSELQHPSPIRPAFAFDDLSYLATRGGPGVLARCLRLPLPAATAVLDPRGGSEPRHPPSFGSLTTRPFERVEDEAQHQHSQQARGTAAYDRRSGATRWMVRIRCP